MSAQDEKHLFKNSQVVLKQAEPGNTLTSATPKDWAKFVILRFKYKNRGQLVFLLYIARY